MPTREFMFRGIPFKIACEETTPQHPSWFSHEDESTVRHDKWLVEPGDCIFDVGAAYGSYSLTALAVGASMAFAWSPQGPPGGRTEASMLRESLALNGWSDRCEIYESGCYDRPGWINALTQEFHVEEPAAHPDVLRVNTLDGWYQSHFRSKFSAGQFPRYWLKLDVEGAEVHVLQGAETLIHDLRPKILVENHNFKRPTLEAEVRALLTGARYREVSTTPYHSVSHSLYEPIQ